MEICVLNNVSAEQAAMKDKEDAKTVGTVTNASDSVSAQSSFTSNASADTSERINCSYEFTPSVGDGSTSTDPIMAALTQTLSVHGIDIIRESITILLHRSNFQ